jgi:ATP-dependent Clp protease ATP-binding subunit ClpA
MSWGQSLRQEVAELCQQAEALGRETDAWLEQHKARQMKRKDYRDDLVFKTNEDALVEPEPPQLFTEEQVEAIAGFVSEYTHKHLAKLREEFDAKLAALERDTDKVLDWPRKRDVA